eukprot:CAMPEP_0196729372 /NCGR_PEP_ID=MMETSP1091-20130531/9789_1 /TAXON_ID=302021 /ORGANISM="Rhodomonas sp., Strain CCMP768" /LENGTH=102 /DNA_ID=CAMNT_0042072253 /DNA_START=29 /DNA_END=337 /DNA_ORIENTATION=+
MFSATMNAHPATKTAGGRRVVRKRNVRRSKQEHPATMPNDKLCEQVPDIVEEDSASTALRLPTASRRGIVTKDAQTPTLQKVSRTAPNLLRMGRIMQPRPGF